MSSIITSVLRMSLGLLWDKARAHTAEKLKERDLTDEQCRQLIVSELDDIKAKIDGLARKDLLASISFLKEGLVFLNLVRDGPSECSLAVVESQAGPFDQACAVARNIVKFHLNTDLNYKSAMKSFEASNLEATRAFSNEALSIEDRITASKLRVASRMLLSLENPDGATQGCILYLESLHGLQAIEEMFTVYLHGGWKSRFNAAKRLENVISVIKISFAVYDFCLTFASKTSVKLLSWPTVTVAGCTKFNPIVANGNILGLIGGSVAVEERLWAQVQDQPSINPLVSVVNSACEFIGTIGVRPRRTGEVFINSPEQRLFFALPTRVAEESSLEVVKLAIDGEDNVYILARSGAANSFCTYQLFIVDPNGNIKGEHALDFIDNCELPVIAVGEGKKVIIAENRNVYVCDSRDLEVFELDVKFQFKSDCVVRELCITNKDKIVLAPWSSPVVVHLYTMKGVLVNMFELPNDHLLESMAFNYVTNEILIYTNYKSRMYCLSRYSTSGKKLQSLKMESFAWHDWCLKSHASGPVTLLGKTGVLHLQ